MKGMEKQLGALIRTKRLEKNFSQQGLCKGICTISYLSKIEQGQGNPSHEIIVALLRQLGIEQFYQEDFLLQAQKNIQQVYDTFFREGPIEHEELALPWQQEYTQQILQSVFFLDGLLFLCLHCTGQEHTPNQYTEELEKHLELLNERQKAIFFSLTYRGEAAVAQFPCGCIFFWEGTNQCMKGKYAQAIGTLDKAFDYAARECNPVLMMKIQVFLGNCYSELQQYEQMEQCYQRAESILRYTNYSRNEEYQSSIHYNRGSTFLQDGMVQKALDCLSRCTVREGHFYHKMAICMEKTGQREKGLQLIEEGLAQLNTKDDNQPRYLRLKLVQFRLEHPDYLQQPDYEQLLFRCKDSLKNAPQGWLRFELPWVLELLAYKRRYKEIATLLQQFSSIDIKLPH